LSLDVVYGRIATSDDDMIKRMMNYTYTREFKCERLVHLATLLGI